MLCSPLGFSGEDISHIAKAEERFPMVDAMIVDEAKAEETFPMVDAGGEEFVSHRQQQGCLPVD